MHSCLREINAYENDFQNYEVSSIFFGGGTPNTISAININKIIDLLSKIFNFSKDIEITMEMNPELINEKYLCDLNYVNRVSLGVQSSHSNELTFLGRNHTFDTVISKVELLKTNNINNINLDLIFALNTSTLESLKQNLDAYLKLAPTHISTYALDIKPGTPFHKDKIKILKSDDELSHLKFIEDYLKENQFNHYEVSSFSKKGYECKHNQHYWALDDYLGIGPSAVSMINMNFYTQTHQLNKYLKHFMKYSDSRKEPVKEIDFIISQFRLRKGLDMKLYTKKFHKHFLNNYKVPINNLKSKNLLEIKDNYLMLTDSGRYIQDSLIQEFII